MKKIIILDRDGVINVDSTEYIKSPEEWQPIPGSLQAIASLNQAGFTVVVATNQSGISRGLYNVNTLEEIHQKMRVALHAVGGVIDKIVYCPHGPWDGCDCRKPKPGLFDQIQKHYQQSLWNVPAIGDSLRDLQAAIKYGCRPILVRTGKGAQTLANCQDVLTLIEPTIYSDLGAVAAALIKETQC